MNVASAVGIPPPSYHEVEARSHRPTLGPPPPYSSHEELWTSLQQTDADGLSENSIELPPSYEEVIAGLTQESTSSGEPSTPGAVPSSDVVPSEFLQALSGASAAVAPAPEQFRLHITKPTGAASRGFGFAFRDGRVTVVLPNSPAQQSGLTEGCRLIEVNGANVENKDKDFICQQIQLHPESIDLLVEPPSNLANVALHTCVLFKPPPPNGYGFAFRGVHISVVLPNSEAARAGLKVGDTLMKINGFSTAGRNRAGLLELININFDQVKVTVSRREFSRVMKPTVVHLRRSQFTGFGFAFRGSRISALLPGAEAERNGLRIGDRILQINGRNVQGATKNTMIRLINSRPDMVTLLAVPDASPLPTG